MEKTTKGMSRRSFIGMGAVAAMAAGAAGLAGCAPAGGDSTAKTEDGGHIESAGSSAPSDVHIHNVTDTSWMTPPAEVTDFAQEWDCDAVVCGHGFAGITACRELAEQGKKVILIEKQPEDSYQAVGNEFASLNAKILQERGVPHIDPVEFYQNFMKITSNMPNPSLVMKFAQNSEENSNWYLDRLTEE
ncbi:FAD-binding protein, partial [Adlercreutzia sp.]